MRTCRRIVSALVVLVLLLLLILARLGHAEAPEVCWRDATALELEGKGWARTAGPFDRLPDSARDQVSKAVWHLSKDSAGICARFVTDADAISLRWSLTGDSLAMPHMPATGVSGVDLYARSKTGDWRFIGNGRPVKKDGNLARIAFPDGGQPHRECLVYLPLYNGTKSLEIGAPSGAHLEKAPSRPKDRRKPVVVYGTSIAQGGCASRPGMAWPAVLGRLLDRPVVNLGFSGSGKMEPPVGEPLAEIDAAVYIIDCIWNMGEGEEKYNTRVPALVRSIRAARPDAPILFVGQSHVRPEAHPTRATLQQEAAVRALMKTGVKGLVLVPGTDLVGDDGEGTVDGVHPNDLGMARQARALLPFVRKALGEENVAAKPKAPGDEIGAAKSAARRIEPLVISRGEAALRYQAFPDACRLKNGDILTVFYAGYAHVSLPNEEFPKGGRVCMVRSSDEGRAWSPPAVLFDGPDDDRDPHIAQLDDGTLICTFFSLAPDDKASGNRPWKGQGVRAVTSRDGGRTWDAEARTLFPDWYCSAPARQLPDGTCVLGLYHKDPATRLSVGGTARSSDRGKTWEDPVPIRAPGVSLDAETDVVRLNDGRLYAALRSAKGLYYAISGDEARSWSEANKTGFPGHCPHFTRLSTGEILLSHRLPATSIHISRDDAKTWEGPFAIDSCIGAYPATVELKDHSVLIVYYTEGAGSVVRARRFRPGPEGIVFLGW